jgi:membrane-bound ClpP family serine protease
MYYQKSLNLRLLIAVILTIVGSGLLIAGFIVPPLGIINGSVLVAFGETSTFIAALLGIDYNYKWKIYKHKLMNKCKNNDGDEIMID